MTVNTVGIAAVAVFYLVILFVGMLAAWKQRKDGRGSSSPEENIMLAKRDLGLFVGVLTMTGKFYIKFKEKLHIQDVIVPNENQVSYLSLCIAFLIMC